MVEMFNKSDESGLWMETGRLEAKEELTFVVNGLDEGQEYAYRVKACNRIGESKPSDSTPYVVAKNQTRTCVPECL